MKLLRRWLSPRPADKPAPRDIPDPRWQRLQSVGVKCADCEELHKGVFDIAFGAPDPWGKPEDYEPNFAVQDALSADRDILTEDFCIAGDARFIRCVLPIPIIGTNATFSFGVWGTIKPEYFQEVLDEFDSGTQGKLGPYFSWLCNTLPFTSPSAVKSKMTMRDKRLRPSLQIVDESHPYEELQRVGMSVDKLFEIYAHCGHKFLHTMN